MELACKLNTWYENTNGKCLIEDFLVNERECVNDFNLSLRRLCSSPWKVEVPEGPILPA